MVLNRFTNFIKEQRVHFPKFVVVGIISTIFNYALFYILLKNLLVNYLVSSGAGYILGVFVGFYLNKVFTFESKSKRYVLEATKYLTVYAVSLIIGLLFLKGLVWIGVPILLANLFNIGLTTCTNYLGSKYMVFLSKKKEKVKIIKTKKEEQNTGIIKNIRSFFVNPIFISVLLIKILLSAFFISEKVATQYLPFIHEFATNPLINTYQHLFNISSGNLFPHPGLMLIITGLPFLILSTIGITTSGIVDHLILRIPLLIADIIVLGVLVSLLPKRKNLIMILYWICPIIIFVNYILGELEIIPIALLLLSFYFLYNEKMHLSSILLGLALATKTGVIMIIPFFFIYLISRKYETKRIIIYVTEIIIIYLLTIIPFISIGYINYVFLAQEHLRLFDLSAQFSKGIFFYLTLAVYAYLIFKALSFKKITRKILFMFTGITFTLFVTLIAPPAFWYLWSIPFLVYLFSLQNSRKEIIYWSFTFLYLIYVLILPESGIFNSFILIKQNTITSGQELLNTIGINGSRILSMIFTLLTANLLYITYFMYNQSIKSSLLFQQKDGISTIGIAGDSGSGKTTLAKQTAKMFGKENVNVICGDDVHRWERGSPMWNRLTHLNPSSNRIHYHQNQMVLMKQGRMVRRSRYNHKTGKFTKPLIVKPKDHIVDEGLHTFMVRRRGLYNLKIYMEPEEELRTYWKIRRDVGKRGYSEKKVLELIEKRKKDSEKYISPQKQEADIIISLKTKEDIRELLKNKKEPKYYVELLIDSRIDIEKLIEKLTMEKNLSLSLDYPDINYQRIIIEGKINNKEIFSIIKKLDIDHVEYHVKKEGIKEGIEGIIQLTILYCLDKKLTRRYLGEL